VEDDVGGVNVVEVAAPPACLVLGVDVAGFSINPDFFLKLRDVLLPRLYLFDSRREFRKSAGRRRDSFGSSTTDSPRSAQRKSLICRAIFIERIGLRNLRSQPVFTALKMIWQWMCRLSVWTAQTNG
jgi:hypothetical protein